MRRGRACGGASQPDWSQIFVRRAAGVRLGLEAVAAAHRRLGGPCAGTPTIAVVGTNGKGTAAHVAARLLEGCGHRVGLYTSPHLASVSERVQVAGRPVEEVALWSACRRVLDVADDRSLPRPLSFFEVLTLAALLVFDEAGADVIVLETGLGGRLDATRVVDAAVLGVTRIGLDHEAVLGPGLRRIAAEKAGAMRAGQRVFSVSQPPEAAAVLAGTAERLGVRLATLSEAALQPSLGPTWPGHLRPAAALGRVLACALDPAAATVPWPVGPPDGRFDERPCGRGTCLFDVAHNDEAVEALAAELRRREWLADLVLLGAAADRSGDRWVRALAPVARAIRWSPLPGECGAPAPAGVPTAASFDEAWRDVCAQTARGGRVVVAGSFRLVGPAMVRAGFLREGITAAVDGQDPRP